jgi:hypothetical protein
MEAVQRALRTLDFQELQRSNSQKVQCKDVASPRPAPSLVSRLAALYFVLSYGLAMYCWILSLIGSVLFPKVCRFCEKPAAAEVAAQIVTNTLNSRSHILLNSRIYRSNVTSTFLDETGKAAQ